MTSSGRDRAARRVVVVPGGPILVEGPIEAVGPDGQVVRSDRFLVAVCACRRSKRYPLCDASHRKKVRTDRVSRTTTGRADRGGGARDDSDSRDGGGTCDSDARGGSGARDGDSGPGLDQP